MIERALDWIHGRYVITTLIHGDCRGADRIAGEVAHGLRPRVEVIPVPADWQAHGRSAGPKRNQFMIDEHQPNLVLAFHADLPRSRGTKDMLRRAWHAGIPAIHFDGAHAKIFHQLSDPDLLDRFALHSMG